VQRGLLEHKAPRAQSQSESESRLKSRSPAKQNGRDASFGWPAAVSDAVSAAAAIKYAMHLSYAHFLCPGTVTISDFKSRAKVNSAVG